MCSALVGWRPGLAGRRVRPSDDLYCARVRALAVPAVAMRATCHGEGFPSDQGGAGMKRPGGEAILDGGLTG